MSGFLVDTNVISEFTKPQPDPKVIRWLETTDPELALRQRRYIWRDQARHRGSAFEQTAYGFG